MQRLELGRDCRKGVDQAAARAGLGHGALHQVLRARAPVLEVDAVFRLEGIGDRFHVLGNGRTVDADHAFLLGTLDQALHAVGALIARDLGHRLCGYCATAGVMASVAAVSVAMESVKADGITGQLHGAAAMWAALFCSALGRWTLAIVLTVEKGACPRKKTRCRALFRGRQHPQDRGMSAAWPLPPGSGKTPRKIASTGAKNAASTGFARARTLHRSRPDPGALGADLRAPARRLGRQCHQDREAA